MKIFKRPGLKDNQQPYMLCIDEQALQGNSFEPSVSLKLSQYSSQPLKHKGFDRSAKEIKQFTKSQKPLVVDLEDSREERMKPKSKKMKPEEMGLKKRDVSINRLKATRMIGFNSLTKSKSKKKQTMDSSVSTAQLELESVKPHKKQFGVEEKTIAAEKKVFTESLETKYLALLQKYKSLKTKADQEEAQGRDQEKKEMFRVKKLEEDLKIAQTEQALLNERILQTENQWKEQRKRAIEEGQELLKKKELEFKNEELNLRIRVQELQSELNILHQKAGFSGVYRNPITVSGPSSGVPLVIEGFNSRRESRLTEIPKYGVVKSVTLAQPRWMNSETLKNSSQQEQLKYLDSIPKESVSTKSMRRLTNMSQPQEPNKNRSMGSMKANPVKQLERVLEQVANDYKKIHIDNKIVKERLEAIQGALLRLEVSVGSTDKTNRTTGQKSTSEIGSRFLTNNQSKKSVGKIGREQAISASVIGNSQINHLVSGISEEFPELPDSTSDLAPSARTSNLKKNWHSGQQVAGSPAKTAPKIDATAASKILNKASKEPIPNSSPQPTQQLQNQSKSGTWTKQYHSLLQEIHKMKDQIETLAEENEDMAILLTDKSTDEPTHDLYFAQPETIRAKKDYKPKIDPRSGSARLATYTKSGTTEEDDSVIDANLDEDDIEVANDSQNNITRSSYSKSATPDPMRYGEQTGLDDTEFYQHH